MSVNISLKALKIKDGKEMVDYFNCFQTKTEITSTILSSTNVEKSYREYVIDFYKNWGDEEYIYLVDVPQSIDEAIAIIDINVGVSHLLKLDRFLHLHSGWKIEWNWF